MVTTRNELQRYINISAITDEELVVAFNNVGLEISMVRKINNIGLKLAKVLHFTTIKGSDHLNWVTLKLLDNTQTKVICGAENVFVDHLVIYAPIGAVINNGMTLIEKTIMGYKSAGMICSLAELGVPNSALIKTESHDIFTLPLQNNWCVFNNEYDDIVKVLGLKDTIFEIELPFNRNDCLGSEQIARELSVYFDVEFKQLCDEKYGHAFHVARKNVNKIIDFDVNSSNPLLSYSEVTYENKPTGGVRFCLSMWFRLRFCGFKLDINQPYATVEMWIMLATGCPTLIINAKDINKKLIFSNKLMFVDINGQKQKGMGFIINSSEIYILGQPRTSYPSAGSKQLVVLSFAIDPVQMRKQQKLINSYNVITQRLIKPIAPYFMYRGPASFLNNFSNQTTGLNGLKTSSLDSFIKKGIVPLSVKVKVNYLNSLLGIKLTKKEIIHFLTKMYFTVSGADPLIVTSPDHRYDIVGPADIAEELGRSYKFNNIPSAPYDHLHGKLKQYRYNNPLATSEENIKNLLIEKGFYQIFTHNLVSEQENKN